MHHYEFRVEGLFDEKILQDFIEIGAPGKTSPAEDYEQVLASIALSIQKRQTRLSELRLRERRATLLVTTWTFAAWAGYVALWWAGIIGVRGQTMRSVGWGLPVVVGPVIILFTRRIVQLWYTQKGNAEEKTLKELLVQQRTKIEEIKKKTNYYSTKSLLDRYDEGPASKPPPKPAKPVQGVARRKPSTHKALLPPLPPLCTLPPLPPPQKQWYDKLADALLGDDTASTGASPSSRYALICERCFSHNGLVKEEQWEDAQYLCPKCGHFNQSARARKALASPTTPQSAVSAASALSVDPSSSASTSLAPQPSSPAPPAPAPPDDAERPDVAVGNDAERMEVDS
ncbi:hypothetical protein BU17DRAFT_76178 [Hysterangium stoloniferum]|nr:hypothetical protein BU17DRAFT_76178 [Hysterangium stoloniferum]